MVVGPLSKEAVAELGTRADRPVPVLALNRMDQVLPASGSALVQFRWPRKMRPAISPSWPLARGPARP